MPRVSVIIPTHNRASFLDRAIRSLIDQTYKDWELIVVDDGSTDESSQVAARFGKQLTYIYQKNTGVCAARNTGFAASRGEFVSFLDSDDRMLPHNLETLITLLDEKPEVDIAYGWYYWVDENGQSKTLEKPQLEGQIISQLVLEETILMGTSLIRREGVDAIGGFDEAVKFQEHWDFYLRLARAGYTYACVKQPVTLLYLHSGNRGQDKDPMLANRVAILDRLFNTPTLEPELANVRQQAYHNAHIEFALDYYADGNFERGARGLNQALQYAPMSSENLKNLANMMAHYASAPEIDSPFDFVNDLFKPIHSTAQVRQLRNKVLGSVNAILAFRHHQAGKLNQVWHHTLSAVMHDPQLWRNRGLMRIGLEGLVGLRLR